MDDQGRMRRRVTQADIDQMAELRRQGHSFAAIGQLVGFSERTARRYVSRVAPRLELPEGSPEPRVRPAVLRERLVRELLEALYHDRRLRSYTVTWMKDLAVFGGPPSVLFLSEAEGLLRDRLERMGDLALGLLVQDGRSKGRFLREAVGPLYWDYVHWHEFQQNFGEAGEDWRPAHECALTDLDDDIPP
jgi:hypothetical protein